MRFGTVQVSHCSFSFRLLDFLFFLAFLQQEWFLRKLCWFTVPQIVSMSTTITDLVETVTHVFFPIIVVELRKTEKQ